MIDGDEIPEPPGDAVNFNHRATLVWGRGRHRAQGWRRGKTTEAVIPRASLPSVFGMRTRIPTVLMSCLEPLMSRKVA